LYSLFLINKERKNKLSTGLIIFLIQLDTGQ